MRFSVLSFDGCLVNPGHGRVSVTARIGGASSTFKVQRPDAATAALTPTR